MAIQLTGLAGFDSSTVVSQLVQIANKPLVDIDSKKSQVDSATTTMSSFASKLGALKTAAAALSTTSGFSSMSVTSTDGAIVPSVTGAATTGSYSLDVTQLARAQKSRSAGQASATAALGQAGDISLTVGGRNVTVSVAATDSLADIASKISRSGARVSAAVVNAGGAYHLLVQGLDTGAANGFAVNESGTVSLGLGVVESAQDARLTVDGLEVTRPTNQITDAVPGVTFALTKTTTTTATLRVGADSGSLKSKVTALVSAYNDVVNAGHSASGYGTTKAMNKVLAADSAIRRSLDRISATLSGLVPGATGAYRSLATVGISLSRDGILAFDAAKLDAALEKDPDAVRRLFVTDPASGATGIMKSLSDVVTALVTTDGGPVKSRIEALNAQSSRLSTERATKAARVDAYEAALKKQFAELDLAMRKAQSLAAQMSSLTG
jgi:flagellar hook-associated protein 2